MAGLNCFYVSSFLGTYLNPKCSSCLLKQVEIHPGTRVMVEKVAWAYALNANSATVFVRHLLTAVFPLETLLVSNLRGGKRGRGDARLPLDKNKLDAIYSTFSAFHVMRFASRPKFLLYFLTSDKELSLHHTNILWCQILVPVMLNTMGDAWRT